MAFTASATTAGCRARLTSYPEGADVKRRAFQPEIRGGASRQADLSEQPQRPSRRPRPSRSSHRHRRRCCLVVRRTPTTSIAGKSRLPVPASVPVPLSRRRARLLQRTRSTAGNEHHQRASPWSAWRVPLQVTTLLCTTRGASEGVGRATPRLLSESGAVRAARADSSSTNRLSPMRPDV